MNDQKTASDARRDAQNDLETKLWDLEAISDLMINVQGDHMSGDDVSKFGGIIWRVTRDAQKAFDEICATRKSEGAS